MPQVLNYLKVTGLERALVINFASSSLEYKRLVLSAGKLCANPVNLWFSNTRNDLTLESDSGRDGWFFGTIAKP